MKKFWKRLFMSYDDMMEDILEENREKMGEESYQKQMKFVKSGGFYAMMIAILCVSLITAPILRRVIFQPQSTQQIR